MTSDSATFMKEIAENSRRPSGKYLPHQLMTQSDSPGIDLGKFIARIASLVVKSNGLMSQNASHFLMQID